MIRWFIHIAFVVSCLIAQFLLLPLFPEPWQFANVAIVVIGVNTLRYTQLQTVLLHALILGFIWDSMGPYAFGTFTVVYVITAACVFWASRTFMSATSLISVCTLVVATTFISGVLLVSVLFFFESYTSVSSLWYITRVEMISVGMTALLGCVSMVTARFVRLPFLLRLNA